MERNDFPDFLSEVVTSDSRKYDGEISGSGEDCQGSGETPDDYSTKILSESLNRASQVFELMNDDEKDKARWRKALITFSLISLGAAIVFSLVVIVLDACAVIELSDTVTIGFFTYIIVNLFSLTYFMAKYITDNKYLETFRAITDPLLNYLTASNKRLSEEAEQSEQSERAEAPQV
jgi:hypothetical protein